jgi:DNA-binding transcriptional LysR family regulator
MLSGVVTERVLDGHLDIALAYTGALEADSPLHCVHWMTDDYLLAVNENSDLARQPPRRLAELGSEDFIMFRRDQSPRLHDLMIHHFHQRGFSPRITQEGTTHYTVLGLVAAGLGCTIIPACAAEQRLPPGVRLLRVPDFDIRMPIHLVWRRDNHTPVIQRFADLLCGGVKPVVGARKRVKKAG